MTGPELDMLIANTEQTIERHQMLYPDEASKLVSELKIYRAMSLRLELCVHELVKEAEGIELPPQVPGFRRMDKMNKQQPQATYGVGESVETAPCPDCGAFPYIGEVQFYSGLGAVAVCASCKKPYRPVIVEVEEI